LGDDLTSSKRELYGVDLDAGTRRCLRRAIKLAASIEEQMARCFLSGCERMGLNTDSCV